MEALVFRSKALGHQAAPTADHGCHAPRCGWPRPEPAASCRCFAVMGERLVKPMVGWWRIEVGEGLRLVIGLDWLSWLMSCWVGWQLTIWSVQRWLAAMLNLWNLPLNNMAYGESMDNILMVEWLMIKGWRKLWWNVWFMGWFGVHGWFNDYN